MEPITEVNEKISLKILQYLLALLIVSSPLFIMVFQIYNESDSAIKNVLTTQLSYDAGNLNKQFDEHLEKIIDDLNLLTVPDENPQDSMRQIRYFIDHMPAVHNISYFSADGNLKFSSTKAKIEWQTNLLNRNWYRELIKDWKPTVSSIHQSPISPFPTVIAVAAPKSIQNQINGFWLIYLDVSKAEQLFPVFDHNEDGKFTVWFDSEGESVKMSPGDKDIPSPELISQNRWWFKINQTQSIDQASGLDITSVDGKLQKNFLYGTSRSQFGKIQVLVVQQDNVAAAPLFSLRKRTLLLAIILQLILLIATIYLMFKWRRRKDELEGYRLQSQELQNLNILLETRTSDLTETNEKLDQLTGELSSQKNELLKSHNQLERMMKFLNFLTVPVVAVNEDLTIDFANKSAERHFGYSSENITKKPLTDILKPTNLIEFLGFLEGVKSDFQTGEFQISIQEEKGLKHFLTDCTYLNLSDWNGYLMTLTELTQILELQNNIKAQNLFLNKSAQIVQAFLNVDKRSEVIEDTLAILKEFSGAKETYFYELNGNALNLKTKLSAGRNQLDQKLLVQNSITGSALLNGQTSIIKTKSSIPENSNVTEKGWSFESAIFKPLVINSKGIGVLVFINPNSEIIENYESTLARLLSHFEIGFSNLFLFDSLKQKNMELDQSTTYRLHLLRTITHGLRTPLSTIKGYTRLMSLKFNSFLKKDPGLINYMSKLDRGIDDMERHIFIYLDLARMNRNDLKFEMGEVSKEEFFTPIINFLNEEAAGRSTKLTVSGTESFPEKMFVDIRRFYLSVQTICLNAVRFAPAGDDILMNFGVRNNSLLITFEDHGPRILDEHISLIGSEFLPSSLTEARIHFGNNLFMAWAVKVIRLAGGALEIESDNIRTVHKITLPIKILN
ncbi:MAG: histidine kinase dimerization/phospho-acceptor domain-containing protein [Calditrichaceae bacterium]